MSAVVSAVLSGFVLATRHADKMAEDSAHYSLLNREKLKAAQGILSESGISLELGS